jgi:rubrerythrin
MQGKLTEEPSARPRDMAELVGLVAAMEAEAVARYGALAAEMERQGELLLAATFRTLLEEERRHDARVAAWSVAVTGAPPAAARWELPGEIARSWQEIAESTRLTPYQALATAVLNEERGFAFYAYIAAHADDDALRAVAEQLAAEELAHAATLRRVRRSAWRREHPGAARPRFIATDDAGAFRQEAAQAEAAAAAIHRRLAAALLRLGDDEGARLLETVAAAERAAAGGVPAPAEARRGDARAAASAPLLRQALAASEQLYDAYADTLEQSQSDAVRREAEGGVERVGQQLALIAARLHAPA